jgi:hypothetical protein
VNAPLAILQSASVRVGFQKGVLQVPMWAGVSSPVVSLLFKDTDARIPRTRNRVRAWLPARLRGHRVKAAWLASPFRPLTAVGEGQNPESASGEARGRGGLGRPRVAPMSKLYAGSLVIASMLALSGCGFLGLVVVTHLINLAAPSGMGQ